MELKFAKYFEIIIILLTSSLIIINEFIKGTNITVKGLILISLVVITISYLLVPSDENSSIYKNSLLSLNLILMTSYTIYQWNRETETEKENCDLMIPTSSNFNSKEYIIFRSVYFSILLVIMTILLILLKTTNNFESNIYYYYIIILLPFIIPILTEVVNLIIYKITKDNINPESIIVNFINGGNKENIKHTIITLIFLLILLIISFIYSTGILDIQSEKPVITLILLLVFISFLGKYIFLQECSIKEENDISELDTNNNTLICSIEKYGGLQFLFCISILAIILNNIESNKNKAISLIMIILSIGTVSQGLILKLPTK